MLKEIKNLDYYSDSNIILDINSLKSKGIEVFKKYCKNAGINKLWRFDKYNNLINYWYIKNMNLDFCSDLSERYEEFIIFEINDTTLDIANLYEIDGKLYYNTEEIEYYDGRRKLSEIKQNIS